MKTVYLVRHAKSSWKDASLDDFDRPLNKRGERDAPFMGELLKKNGIKPDVILSSPANRAITTAKIIAKEMGYPEKAIVEDKTVYLATAGELLSIIQDLDDKVNSVMIFGHNPGLTTFGNYLGDKYNDNIPTCAITGIELNIDDWDDARPDVGKTFLYEYPKKYFT